MDATLVADDEPGPWNYDLAAARHRSDHRSLLRSAVTVMRRAGRIANRR